MKRRWGTVHDWLVGHLTPEQFATFTKTFGGQFIKIPRQRRETRDERTQRVLEALGSGLSYREAAAATGIPRSTMVNDGKRGMGDSSTTNMDAAPDRRRYARTG